MKTKFDPKQSAPENQQGKIIVSFQFELMTYQKTLDYLIAKFTNVSKRRLHCLQRRYW